MNNNVNIALIAVFAVLTMPFGASAARSFGEIAVNKVDNVVESFDVNFAATTEMKTNTLIFAYGATNGGDTTNGWEHVEIIGYVKPDELVRHVAAPSGCGSEIFYARFFLSEGMAIPYDMRYESYTKKGNSYIDTLYIPNQATRVVADLTVNGMEYWFGCWADGFGQNAFAIRWENANSVYRGYNGCHNVKSGLDFQTGKRYLLDFNRNVVSMTCEDGTLAFPTNTCTAYSSFSTKPRTLYLFAFNQSGTYTSGGATTFHSCKIYDNDTLVRDLIPVSKDGTAYMFDVANCVMYPFLDGTPTAGAVVENDPYAGVVGPVNASSSLVEIEDIREFAVVRWDPSATGTGDGKSWANAYTDFAEALARAGAYAGEVWIKGGTYTVDKAMTVKSHVAILGGFAGVDGVYANDDAERAARDPKAHPVAFTTTSKTQVDLDKSGAVDATAVVDGITFRNSSGGWLVYSSNSGATYGYPTFTNCTFSGAAIVLQKCAASFADCRFLALTSGTFGRIFLENTLEKVVFSECSFVSVTNNSEYGLINYAGGSKVRLERCCFEDCVGQNATGPATLRYGSGSCDTLESCVFLNCQSAGGKIATGQTMINGRVEGCRSTGISLFDMAGRTERTTFVNNIVHVDAPSVTSGTNYVDVLNTWSQRTTFVNCTFAGNVVEANYGEGATVVRSTVRWSLSSSMGGALNCTFKDNAVDHDLVACGIVNNNKDYVNGYDVQLVNVVTSNPDANYRAMRTFNCKTGGFCVYSSYLQGFVADQSYAFIQLSDDIRTDDARCSNTVIDDGVHRAIPLYSPASAKKRCGRLVQVGANGTYRFKNANGTYISSFNSATAPTEPIVTIGDIFGAERPADQLVPGSCQSMVHSGLMLQVR